MKANAPEKIYVHEASASELTEKLPYHIEYVRTDAFVEKAAECLYNYNQKQVLKHGARATLGCGEYTINVEEFKNAMKL